MAVAPAPHSCAEVLFSLKSPLEIWRERSAETSVLREHFTASNAGGVALVIVSSGDAARRLYETLPTTLSRVVPASRATMAVRARVKRLNSELLPTLAWPMMATVGNLLGIIMPIITEARRFGEGQYYSPLAGAGAASAVGVGLLSDADGVPPHSGLLGMTIN